MFNVFQTFNCDTGNHIIVRQKKIMEFDIHLVLLKNSFIMKTNQILTADILDIIFDGKNKSYGAYDLRKTYNGRLTRAVIITVIMMLLVFAGTVLSGMTSKSATGQIEIADMEMKDVKIPGCLFPHRRHLRLNHRRRLKLTRKDSWPQ